LVFFRKKLDLHHPKTYNEKIQWLKLHDRNPEYVRFVDKYAVYPYVKEKIGEQYLIPLLGVWDSFDDIDFSVLPNQFVLKCTHDSGGIAICKDKRTFDRAAAREGLNRSMRKNYFYYLREWPYKDIKPRIIAQAYLKDEAGSGLWDYKFFCFHGEPKVMFIVSDRKRTRETIISIWTSIICRLRAGIPTPTSRPRNPPNSRKCEGSRPCCPRGCRMCGWIFSAITARSTSGADHVPLEWADAVQSSQVRRTARQLDPASVTGAARRKTLVCEGPEAIVSLQSHRVPAVRLER
jgi:hypothetical protein